MASPADVIRANTESILERGRQARALRDSRAREERLLNEANARDDAIRTERVQREKVQNQRKFAVETAQQFPDLDLGKISPLVPDIPTAEFDSLRVLQKEQQKKRRDQVQAEGGVQDVMLDPSVAPPSGSAEEARLLSQLDPEIREDLEVRRQDPTRADDLRKTAEGDRKLMFTTAVARFADAMEDDGFLSVLEEDEITQELLDTGISAAVVLSEAAKAKAVAPAEFQERQRFKRTTAGERADVAALEVNIEDRVSRFESLNVEVTPEMRKAIERGERLILHNEGAFFDPRSEAIGKPLYHRASSKAAAAKQEEALRSQLVMRGQFDIVRSSFQGLREAAKVRGGIANVPEAIQDIRETFGASDPAVAAYRNARFQFVSALLKATQGARPSDFDLRMYLSLLPFSSEALSGAADEKLRIMEQQLELQMRVSGHPEVAQQIEARTRRGRNAQESKMQSLGNQILSRLDSNGGQDDEEVLRLMDDLMTEASAWSKTQRAKEFRLPGATAEEQQQNPLSEEEQAFADEFGI